MRKILFFALFMCTLLSAQEKHYCVVSFTEKGRTFENLIHEYWWIIPLDELDTSLMDSVPLYPFIVGEDELIDDYRVCRGNFYWLDIIHYPAMRKKEHSSETIVRKNRKLIQSFSYSIPGERRRYTVKVFITPIEGEIESTADPRDNQTILYSNKFRYWDGFYQDSDLFDYIQRLPLPYIQYFTPKERRLSY